MSETATDEVVEVVGEANQADLDQSYLFHAHANADDTDDFVCTATKPKMYVMLQLAAALGDANELRQVLALEQMLDKVVSPDTAVHLRARFSDEDDLLDVDWLQPFFMGAMGRWFGDPTRAASGSRSSQRRTGGSSTARRPSKG